MTAGSLRLPFFLWVMALLLAGTAPAADWRQAATAATAKSAKGWQPARKINAARAMRYLREIVGMGPRPVGGAAHERLQSYLRSHLQGDALEEDAFDAQTPAGHFPMRNFIAKYSGKKDGIIVIASHYDTLYALKDFVGANDGGSSTALLLELANQLRRRQREGYSVWLVWFDGEEAIQQWSPSDSLYGSRHLAAKWRDSGALKEVRAFFLLDMVGQADLNIDRDLGSDAKLEDLVMQAATALGYQSHFFGRTIQVQDDHIPFAQAGVPVADLIDFDYGYGNAFWHTTQDTLDKLSANSLRIVGDVVLETLRLLNSR